MSIELVLSQSCTPTMEEKNIIGVGTKCGWGPEGVQWADWGPEGVQKGVQIGGSTFSTDPIKWPCFSRQCFRIYLYYCFVSLSKYLSTAGQWQQNISVVQSFQNLAQMVSAVLALDINYENYKEYRRTRVNLEQGLSCLPFHGVLNFVTKTYAMS